MSKLGRRSLVKRAAIGVSGHAQPLTARTSTSTATALAAHRARSCCPRHASTGIATTHEAKNAHATVWSSLTAIRAVEGFMQPRGIEVLSLGFCAFR